MVAPIDICNGAIMRLGGQLITSLTENSVAAIACNSQYDIVRRDLLRSHPWNFAIKFAALAQNLTPPLFSYDFSYALPTDCLRVLTTQDQLDSYLFNYGGDFNGFVTINNKVDYALADVYKIVGRDLYSNNGTVKIRYIADITDTSMFDPSFVELLQIRLAYVICYQLTGSTQMRNDLKVELEELMRSAKENNGQEGTRERIEMSAWLTSRG